MKSLVGPFIKCVIFILVSVLTTALLAITIVNGSSGGGDTFRALLSNAI
jgi:phospholipid/cholesterol/gamma-HCH transport system substrate-binding protein